MDTKARRIRTLRTSQRRASSHGASTPAGATWVAQNELGAAASTGMQAERLKAELKLIKEQADNTFEDTDLKKWQKGAAETQAQVHQAQAGLLRQQTQTEKAETESAAYTAQMLRDRLPGSSVEREIDEGKYGEFFRYLQRLVPGLGAGSSALRNLRPR